jgi:phage shock protein E
MKTIIDVRTREECCVERSPNTINIPVEEITASKMGELWDLPKDSEICVCCVSGVRAEKAKKALNMLGFTNVKNLGSFRNIPKN